MWNKPYSYAEGTAICIGLLITGGLLQMTVGPLEWIIFKWPGNIIALAFLLVILILFYLLRRKAYFFRFITTVKAAVPALTTAAVLTVIMGLTRQVPEGKNPADPIGLTKMLSFWPFVLIYLWNVMIVAEEALFQACHFQRKFIPSLISHTGIFIFIVCGTLGSADMQKLKMFCEEGKPEWRGLDADNHVIELPIAIQLNRFTIDEYPPKLMVINMRDGLPQPEKKPATLVIDKDYQPSTLLGWKVEIVKRIDNALPATMAKMMAGMPEGMASQMKMDSLGMRLNTGGFVPYNGKGAACALYVRATKGNRHQKGWVSCGSYLFPLTGVSLDDHLELVMPQREPMRYASDVNIYTEKDERNIHTTIEVNKPYSIGSWKIYQLSYNEQMGKWSNLSIFEFVSDPWLQATYVGLFLLIIGAILMFIQSRHASIHQTSQEH
ncbi:MAG: cytochrome c biogenesis protein ResB [Prevotella sp.]|nr:cytochrome c biogenesis protein ResB [Prevotella sp.]